MMHDALETFVEALRRSPFAFTGWMEWKTVARS